MNSKNTNYIVIFFASVGLLVLGFYIGKSFYNNGSTATNILERTINATILAGYLEKGEINKARSILNSINDSNVIQIEVLHLSFTEKEKWQACKLLKSIKKHRELYPLANKLDGTSRKSVDGILKKWSSCES